MLEREKVYNTEFNIENSYSELPQIFYTKQLPSLVKDPKIAVFNKSLAKTLGLNIDILESDKGADIFSGNKLIDGSNPIAQAYAGHQFGYFTMLGDGRAVLLGEHITPKGEKVDVQLKGSGITPYSRGGDGKAALGPMIREYIISEAMYSLGIPTTRSLTVVTTGESIAREKIEPGAILTRIASSHIRVGTFQFAARYTDYESLKALADYTIKRHYPEGLNKENPYLFLLEEVIKRQAKLIAKWLHVGFIHGVMNTDNVSICGETIDYGPCAFMDTYDPSTVFSSIDHQGRYAYENQPNIIAWDLARFAETLIPLLNDNQEEAVDIAQNAMNKFNDIYKENYISGMRLKLGLFNEEKEDEDLIYSLLSLMHKYVADYTNTFRNLTLGKKDDIVMFTTSEFNNWYSRWQERLSRQKESKDEVLNLMKSVNPSVIPRNHRVEEAIEAAVKKDDYSVMTKLLEVLSNPYSYNKDQEEYTKLPKPTNIPYRTFCGT
ncbi:YdiU family protein [Clostridium sp. AL.422]|uniref:protein adenylyltransferase SelO n=1 Tax=Clostridium TaxID=1485 RepID=UPI00293DFA56|nr:MULTISPECIES: YdiU family protein [unclassified Clostridium]MDV4152609.1 YdiU family protein [Clostridium sp. AL.422]